jgi:multiple sugar transport system permease protein
MYNKKRLFMGYSFLLPALLLFAVFVAYPVLNTIKTSFYSLRIQTIGTGGKWIGLDNLTHLIKDENMWISLRFTVLFTVVSVILESFLGMVCALVMNRTFKGKAVICAAILIPWCIPTVVSGLMWSYMFAEAYGVINQILQMAGLISRPVKWITGSAESFWAIVIADVWKTAPYMSLLLLSGLKTVPKDYYEAAAIDGAGKVRQFFSITVPSIKSVIVVSLMFRTISSFRIYDLIKVLTNGGPGNSTTSLTMYTMQQYFSFGNYGYGSALAVLTFAVSLVIAFFFYDGMKSKLEL